MKFVRSHDGINDKAKLSRLVAEHFELTRDRSVFYGPHFAVRFSASTTRGFPGTVTSLSRLRGYDDRPFIACIVKPTENVCLLANTTFLKKISQTSPAATGQQHPWQFQRLRHFPRVRRASPTRRTISARFTKFTPRSDSKETWCGSSKPTNDISPTGVKFAVTDAARAIILDAPRRAMAFTASSGSSNA